MIDPQRIESLAQLERQLRDGWESVRADSQTAGWDDLRQLALVNRRLAEAMVSSREAFLMRLGPAPSPAPTPSPEPDPPMPGGGFTPIPSGAEVVYLDDGQDIEITRGGISGDRPLVLTAPAGRRVPARLKVWGPTIPGGGRETLRHLWVVGISGSIDINGPVDDVLIEDCDLHGVRMGLVIQYNAERYAQTRVRVRHNIFRDIHDGGGSADSSGLYISGVDGLTIESNVLYRCGLNPQDQYDLRNHGMYLHGCRRVGVHRNIIDQANSFGIKLAANDPAMQISDHMVESNIVSRCCHGITLGGNSTQDLGEREVWIGDNLLAGLGRATPRIYGIHGVSMRRGAIIGNWLIHPQVSPGRAAILLDADRPHHDVNIEDNAAHGWGDTLVDAPATVTTNGQRRLHSPPTLDDWALIRGHGTWQRAVEEAINRPRGAMPEFGADEVFDWIQANTPT